MLILPALRAAALMLAPFSLLGLAAGAVIVARPATGDEGAVIGVRADDPQMTAAIAEARRTLPEFLALLADPPPGFTGFAFKYALDGWEHIWVDHVERRGDRLVGRLGDVPLAEGYRKGQRVVVPIARVSDWAYRDARGVMHGHRTTRVLLPLVDSAYRRDVRAAFGWSD